MRRTLIAMACLVAVGVVPGASQADLPGCGPLAGAPSQDVVHCHTSDSHPDDWEDDAGEIYVVAGDAAIGICGFTPGAPGSPDFDPSRTDLDPMVYPSGGWQNEGCKGKKEEK